MVATAESGTSVPLPVLSEVVVAVLLVVWLPFEVGVVLATTPFDSCVPFESEPLVAWT